MQHDKRPSLSKSRFLSGLQCPKRLYMETHEKEAAMPPDAYQKRIFTAGHTVGELARGRFPSGVLIEASFSEVERAIEETRREIEANTPVLFEAAFLWHDTFVRADILERSGEAWNIIEVKSTCTVHDIHLLDLAIQRFVIEGSGLPVAATMLMHLNHDCRFPNLQNLFLQTDLTEAVRQKLPSVQATIETFLEVLAADNPPPTLIGPHCFHPYPCPFKTHCWKDVREPSIFVIPKLHPSRARELISKGITSILDIPPDYPLSETQGQYVRQLQSTQPTILWPAISDLLSALEFPLYFLNIQVIMDTIPRLKGFRPFDQYPYQCTVYTRDAQNSSRQTHYLQTDASDPRPLVAQYLCNEIGPSGSVVVYNGTAERRIIKNLAWDVGAFRGELLSIFDRVFDLLPIFQRFYFDPRFAGSTDLQAIAPVLLPELSSSRLAFRDTHEAHLAWEHLIYLENEKDRSSLVDALTAFGAHSALILQRIYEHLRKQSSESMTSSNSSGNNRRR